MPIAKGMVTMSNKGKHQKQSIELCQFNHSSGQLTYHWRTHTQEVRRTNK